MLTKSQLCEKFTAYHSQADIDLIGKAYDLLLSAHDGIARDSGEPYASHPIAVADILMGIHCDQDMLIAALLHDTVEDTKVTLDQLAADYGPSVANLVDGVTKLSEIELDQEGGGNKNKVALNMRKLVLSIIEDERVLAIKLADRLHNMRTLSSKKKASSRRRSAQETLDVFINLAAFIGLNQWREELADIAFRELEPDKYKTAIAAIEAQGANISDLIDKVTTSFSQIIKEDGINAQISGRIKSPYSIWHKSSRKSQRPEDLADLVGFRLIMESEADCYRALGALHTRFHMGPSTEFDDYISNPKVNGYQSIHTTIRFPCEVERRSGTTDQLTTRTILLLIEVQIRTQAMHENAEKGDASHLSYKRLMDSEEKKGQQKNGKPVNARLRTKKATRISSLDSILQDLVDFYDKGAGFMQTLAEHTKEHIQVVTPQGKIKHIPPNSTLLDFAYYVHSDIGNHCGGAKLDGHSMPLNTLIGESGHTVEILVSKHVEVNVIWKSWANTPKALKEIKSTLDRQDKVRLAAQGELALKSTFATHNYDYGHKGIENALTKLGLKGEDGLREVFERVGKFVDATNDGKAESYLTRERGYLSPREVLLAVYPGARSDNRPEDVTLKPDAESRAKRILSLEVGKADGSNPLNRHDTIFHFGRCCSPLPGDNILGILTTQTQVSIHRRECPSLENFSNMGDRWVVVSWRNDAQNVAKYNLRLRAFMQNRPGVLNDLTRTIAREGINISDVRFKQRHADIYVADIDLEVTHVKHYYNISAALKALDGITDVTRF